MTKEEAIEQLNFMIENIPKEPPTECDSIKELLDTDKDIRNALNMAIRALEQEPKIGHWNTYTLSQRGIDEEWLECSECMWSNALSIPRKYCPNCGAKMEEKGRH